MGRCFWISRSTFWPEDFCRNLYLVKNRLTSAKTSKPSLRLKGVLSGSPVIFGSSS